MHLTKSKIKVFVFDPANIDRAIGMCSSLDTWFDAVLFNEGTLYRANKQVVVEWGSDCELAFVHAGDLGDFAKTSIATHCIVTYSGGGLADLSVAVQSGREPFSQAYCKHIIDVLSKRGRDKWKEQIAEYWKHSFDSLYALRLLCEAWLLVHRDRREEAAGGISIKAPKEALEWFKPFNESTANPDAITRIVKQMHGAQGSVKTFFEKVVNGCSCDECDVDEIVKAIDLAVAGSRSSAK